jgi:hypothetical protein
VLSAGAPVGICKNTCMALHDIGACRGLQYCKKTLGSLASPWAKLLGRASQLAVRANAGCEMMGCSRCGRMGVGCKAR